MTDTTEKRAKATKNWTFGIAILFLVGLVASYFIFPGFQDGVNEAFVVITSEDDDRIKAWVKKFGEYEIAGNQSYKEKYLNPEGPVLRCLRSFFSSIGH